MVPALDPVHFRLLVPVQDSAWLDVSCSLLDSSYYEMLPSLQSMARMGVILVAMDSVWSDSPLSVQRIVQFGTVLSIPNPVHLSLLLSSHVIANSGLSVTIFGLSYPSLLPLVLDSTQTEMALPTRFLAIPDTLLLALNLSHLEPASLFQNVTCVGSLMSACGKIALGMILSILNLLLLDPVLFLHAFA